MAGRAEYHALLSHRRIGRIRVVGRDEPWNIHQDCPWSWFAGQETYLHGTVLGAVVSESPGAAPGRDVRARSKIATHSP